MPESVMDSYSETNLDASIPITALHPSGNPDLSAVSQSFTTPNDGKQYYLSKAKFYLKKTGVPEAIFNAVLYAESDDKPTGAALGTSGTYQVSNLTGDYQLISFTFSGAQRYQMAANTKYCVALQATSVTTLGIANSVHVGVDGSAPSHAGISSVYASAAWALSGEDCCFYVYGELDTLTITAVDNVTTDPAEGVHPDYDLNDEVQVTATPDGNYYLSDWLLDSVSQESTDNPFTVTMDDDRELAAVVTLKPYLTVTAPSNGSLSEASGYKEVNEEIGVTATADTGYFFHHWTLDGLNKGYYNPITVTMDTNHTLASTFYRRNKLFADILSNFKRM